MAKFAQYYLRYNLENLFADEFKDQRQQIFGAFFETDESIVFTSGEGDDRKVYKHQSLSPGAKHAHYRDAHCERQEKDG